MSTAVTGRYRQGYAWIGGSIVLVTLAQLGMKIGMSHLPTLMAIWSDVQALAVNVLLGYWPWLALIGGGILAYGISMWCWLNALRHLPLSRAYPLLSISYVTVYAVAVVTPILHEAFKIQHLIGIAMILIGVVVISRCSTASPHH
ncbi:4-amino-4-deoxy-L-arabinose-phosphoundecaprenol flippase subunit ArnF [Zymobacter palmae]|uniref:Probable 4-amino-4-deoxy-L-arabinose-phosphoundecaprenol flippase subunit ArnF n=1 Tax=Zymobacter palmae TaxID=33074 RepID=A0A348HFB3_9GAMM|nr:4-amino-4-deoxy-L-arabinose-phosphoundecaprenol flippase subunit ArnF [Zymobacter palmae]BBG30315.1 permeases of the drug/metabolite transporter [Zymobacter palmae]